MRDLKSGMGEFKVNGRTYKFDLLPPMEAIDFGSRVLKAAGGALVSICGEGEVHYDAIAKALSVRIRLSRSPSATKLCSILGSTKTLKTSLLRERWLSLNR